MKGKIFEHLCKAFPLKPIESDVQLQGAVEAHDRTSKFLHDEEPTSAHQDQIEDYLSQLEELISTYRNRSSTH